MKRLVALVGLVLVSLGLATPAMADSGTDPSGTHSYSLECVDGVAEFTNTSVEGRIAVRDVDGLIQLDLDLGEAGEYSWDGGWSVAFEDPVGSETWVEFDAGTESPSDVCEVPPIYSASSRLVCATESIRITNTGNTTFAAYGATIGSRTEILPGQSATVPWGRDPFGNMLDTSTVEARTINADGSETMFYWATFVLADYRVACAVKTYSYTAVPVCVADFPHVRFTATGTGDVYIAQNSHSAGLAKAGGPPITLPWDEHQAIPFPTTDWDAIRTDTSQVFDSGSFTLAEDNPCVTAPTAPRSLTVTPGNGRAVLRWVAPAANGGAAVTDYIIQRRVGTGAWTTVNDGVRATTGYTVTGLRNGTRYYFRVVAKNAAGNSPVSNTVNAIPRTVPSAPRSLRATFGNRRVTLTWTPPASNGGSTVTRYVLQRSTRPTSRWVNVSTAIRPTARSFINTGLRNGTRYYFRIVAVNAAGTGAWSTTVNATPR